MKRDKYCVSFEKNKGRVFFLSAFGYCVEKLVVIILSTVL